MLASPVKGGVPVSYVQSIIEQLRMKLPEVQFGYAFHEGASVNCARNEIARMVITDGYDEVIMSDVDMRVRPQDFFRLLGHDVPFVAGIYCRREAPTDWLFTGIETEQVRPNGLLKVYEGALGFCKIKVKEVFGAIVKTSPEYAMVTRDHAHAPDVLTHEFFPMGLEGPNSILGRYEKLKEWHAKWKENLSGKTIPIIEKELNDILHAKTDQPSRFLGEDYYFCRLMRKAGIEILLDTHLIIPHRGWCDWPIPTDKLFSMLSEPWRKDEIMEIKRQREEAAKKAAEAEKKGQK